MKSISSIISFFALLAAIASAFYSKRQVEVAENAYNSAVDQLSLYQQEIKIAKANFETAQVQLNLQRAALDRDREFAIVIDSASKESLLYPLIHGRQIDIVFHNSSKYPYAYKVFVKSEGFGVYWTNHPLPSNMIYQISLDRGSIVVNPNDSYNGRFVVMYATVPARRGRLRIYVNDMLLLDNSYRYDKVSASYVYQES